MVRVENDISAFVLRMFGEDEIVIDAGGSCGNTVYGVSYLGSKVGYMGAIGRGKLDDFYMNSFLPSVKLNLVRCEGVRTGHCISLVTPDKERTMLTHLGASHGLRLEHLVEEDISDSKILHLEAYMIEVPSLREVIDRACYIAKKNDVIVSFDLSSAGLIERNYDDFHNFISDNVDIVFANEEEAKAFTKRKLPEDALKRIIKGCRTAVLKMGEGGSFIGSNEEFFHFPAYRRDVKDTTGAGDMFAAGFLYGVSHKYGLKSSARIASYFASKVCAQVGARLK